MPRKKKIRIGSRPKYARRKRPATAATAKAATRAASTETAVVASTSTSSFQCEFPELKYEPIEATGATSKEEDMITDQNTQYNRRPKYARRKRTATAATAKAATRAALAETAAAATSTSSFPCEFPALKYEPNEATGATSKEGDMITDQNTQGKPIYRARPPQAEVAPFNVGSMDLRCPFCGAFVFPGERNICCHNGKVDLPKLSTYPDYLKQLLTQTDQVSKYFQNNIRQYNSAFAFVSMGVKLAPPPNIGPYCFRIHDQIYHRLDAPHPQLYVFDWDGVEDHSCEPEIMQQVRKTLQQISPYAASHKHMLLVEQEQEQEARLLGIPLSSFTMHMTSGNDRSRCSDPWKNEVAAIFIGEEGAPTVKRHMVKYPKLGAPATISMYSAVCDPMTYPILFPRGDFGWAEGLEHSKVYKSRQHNQVTSRQFYCYRLAIREEFSPLHYAGKLLQQYIVDAYVKTEAVRLAYLKDNHQDLYATLYRGFKDHVANAAALQNISPGEKVVPLCYKGSPKTIMQNYLDVMAIVVKYGKPDLLLTFACDPRSKDVTDNLFAGQHPEQRPDIVARVFSLQLQSLLADLKGNKVLGCVAAMLHVIEFQKGGFPVAHILLILDPGSKLRNAADIDTAISAEIPDPDTDPVLHHIIKSTMVHGPCGQLNPNASCMKKGVCLKGYPKEFQEQTIFAENGYPTYRRRDNGRTIRVGHFDVDNRWILPYNAWLSRKYNAHIKVEACTTMKSIKCLFKYIDKGHGCAQVEVQETSDRGEVSSLLDCRYISALEAYWRLSEYRMQEMSHPIVSLPIHVPSQGPGHKQEALDTATTPQAMLNAWFSLNATTYEAREYLYTEIPKYYLFVTAEKKWRPRRRPNDLVIGRMYSVSQNYIEGFCLRLLLLHIRGACSFQDLRTIDGVTVDTFKEACHLLNLLPSEGEWDSALTEAAALHMPQGMRSLYATICVHCRPPNPVELWDKHKDSLAEDYKRIRLSDVENRALQDIEVCLSPTGLNVEKIGLPAVQHYPPGESPEFESSKSALNSERKAILDKVLATVREVQHDCPPRSRTFFLDGPSGSSKTTLYNVITTTLKAEGFKVASVAWTESAAKNCCKLQDRRTVHDVFKVPIPPQETSGCGFPTNDKHADMLSSVDLYIIDEASVIPRDSLNEINLSLQGMMCNNVPFGGKPVLLGGDFKHGLPLLQGQVLPRNIQMVMKSQEDQQELKWDLELGRDKLSASPQLGQLKTQSSSFQPTECEIKQEGFPESWFPKPENENTDPSHTIVVTPLNDDTLLLEEHVLETIPGQTKTYWSSDKALGDDREDGAYPIEFLHSLTPSGLPPHKLNLKQSAFVMLLCNLDMSKGLSTGTYLQLHHMHKHILVAGIISGSHAGNYVFIPRIKLASTDENLPFTLERLQFPVRLANTLGSVLP